MIKDIIKIIKYRLTHKRPTKSRCGVSIEELMWNTGESKDDLEKALRNLMGIGFVDKLKQL